jgi:hypothetical protein
MKDLDMPVSDARSLLARLEGKQPIDPKAAR